MTNEEWSELARFLRGQLKKVGLHDIADFSAYVDADEDGERRFPTGQELVKEMLDALRRHVTVNSRETLEMSMDTLRECVEGGRRLKQALVHFDEERARAEGRESEQVATLGSMVAILGRLDALERDLFEGPGDSEPDRRS